MSGLAVAEAYECGEPALEPDPEADAEEWDRPWVCSDRS